MPTVSWEGPFAICARRVLELVSVDPGPVEFLLAFDGPACEVPDWLVDGAAVVFSGRCRGPAFARNHAASRATGDVLFFLDADVEPAADCLERVRAAFDNTPDLVAVFGAYDDAPACQTVVGQFRNLLHHHTHVSHPGRAATFWAGCGAVKASAFADLGGFDEDYRHPSVEDIELGMRLRDAGGRIDLDPLLRGKHHKAWTLGSMIRTDIRDRAVPWTKLIAESGEMPVTLNIDWSNRLCGVASLLLAAMIPTTVVAAIRWPGSPLMLCSAAAGLLLLAGLIYAHLDFYRLCRVRRGLAFSASAIFLHWLFYLYASLTFAVVWTSCMLAAARRPAPVDPLAERAADGGVDR